MPRKSRSPGLSKNRRMDGKRILRGDRMKGTARVHGLTVVTRNVKDFEVAGVQVLNPVAE